MHLEGRFYFKSIMVIKEAKFILLKSWILLLIWGLPETEIRNQLASEFFWTLEYFRNSSRFFSRSFQDFVSLSDEILTGKVDEYQRKCHLCPLHTSICYFFFYIFQLFLSKCPSRNPFCNSEQNFDPKCSQLPYMVFCYQNCSDLLWEKNYSTDGEKLLKFKAERRELATFLRSLEQFIQTVKGQNNFG